MAYEAPQNGLSQPATELAFAAADTDSIALDSLSRSHSFPNFGAGLSLAGDTPTKMSPFSSLDNSSPASPVFETPTASATFKQPRSRAPSTSGGTFSSHAFDPSTQTSWPNAAAPMPTAINGTIHIDPTSTSHAMQLSHNVSGPPPPPVQSLPQTAPATSFDSQNYFDPRPGAMTLDRQASDPQNIFHQAQVFTSPSFVTSADTDMGSSRPVSQKSSRESFKEERARGAFTQLESLLAQVRPAVMDSQHATPLSPGQASLLDQAWKQFGDYFLQAAVISRPADGSEDQRTPDDSHDSGLSVKGERKRVLSVEGDAPPPPAKRSESTAGGRRLTGGTSDLPCAPPLAHTRSSPAMSRPHVVSTTSSASVPSLASTSASTSFLHATAAPSAPYNSPAASFSSAVAAGLHLPFGSDVGQDPSSLTAFTSSLPHAPVMPSPLSGSMISSQDSAPQAASGRQHATQSDSIPGHSGFAGTDAPSFAQPESVALQRGHSHTKSWGFSSINDSLLSPVSADAPRSASATSSAPRTTRTRSSTIGAQPSSFSRPPSPIDELYMPAGVGGDISSELKESMNTVFVEWLQTLCNDLDATDSKGELIHQTLMAKRMQKLDEVGEYRPFKFRIQAFTNRFSEELLAKGFSEAQVPHKIVRIFLWNQPLISRYNEEGKKAKSKGNHVWSIDARKIGEGQWHFRPFQRRIVTPPAKTATVGLPWAWEARIWDPQVSTIKATFSSPHLPEWLSWKYSEHSEMVSELSGIPPTSMCQDGEDTLFPIHVVAEFEIQGTPTQLEIDFELQITAAGSSFSRTTSTSRPTSSNGPMSLDVSMSAPSDVASIPPPPPPGIEAVSAATSFLDEQAVEHSEVVQKFAEKSSLEPEQAKATLEACIAPANLLAHESQVYGDGAGPLATALAARDNAIHAFSYASHVHHSADVLTNLSAQAHEADQTAKKVMSDAQVNIIQSLMVNPSVPATAPITTVPNEAPIFRHLP